MSERQPPWLRQNRPPPGKGPSPNGPEAGEIYHVDTALLSKRDTHVDRYRPVVVVKVKRDLRLVMVYTRTTDTHERGVHHPKDLALSLDRDGVFAERWDQSVDLGMFVYPLVIRRGRLDPATFARVIEMWERS